MDTEMPSTTGDLAAFSEDLRRDSPRIHGYIHSLVRDLNDADDVFQQVAVILWRKYGQFDRSRSFVAWACGVAHLEVSNFLRVRGRSRLYLSDDLNRLLAEAQAEMSRDEGEERRRALEACVGKLRERDRALLEQCYRGDSGVAPVAEREGRSPRSVHNSLRRIRRALFECIGRALRRELEPGALS